MKHESVSIYKNEFIDAVRTRLGINVNDNQIDTLLSTVDGACEKFNCSPLEFLQMIKSENDASPALVYLSANITIGETYFFRDKRQMKLLEGFVLPKMIAEKRNTNNQTMRIWSAGSSSGEEIYTVAMLLKELIPDIDNWVIFLLGTDINVLQLNKAVKGIYSEWSMRSISSYYKNKYFTYDNGFYYISDSIKSMVNFSYLNLNDENYPSILNNTNAQDLIICRNVLIYFEEDSITRLMSRMSLCLVNNGYLLLGASDPINVNINNLIRHPEHSTLLMRKVIASPEINSKQSVIIHTDNEIEAPNAEIRLKNRDKIIVNKVQIKKEVINPILLANEGKLQEAVTEFKNLLNEQKTNTQLYLDLAMTLIELNRLSEAEEALKKVIFLDNKYVMAHFQLGILKLRLGQKLEGLRCLKNALRIAKNESPNEEVKGNPGMVYGKLAEILEKELLIFYD